MIFCTLGNDRHPFNRFTNILEDVIKNTLLDPQDFIYQFGYSSPTKSAILQEAFFPKEQFDQLIGEADFIITHAGAGTIAQAIQSNKKPIVIPRLNKFNEHLNDHQLDIAKYFLKEGLCYVCSNSIEVINAISMTSTNPLNYHSKKKDFITAIEYEINKYF